MRRPVVLVLAGLLTVLAGCGSAPEATTRPPTAAPDGASTGAGPTPPAGPSGNPSGNPSGSPSAGSPGSGATEGSTAGSSGPLEVDPAVAALRAYYAAAALAVNADDFQLPELVALSTPTRQQANATAFITDRGGYVPGPTPFTPLSASALSATRRAVVLCALDSGWVLDSRGGTPLGPDAVLALRAELVQTGAGWQVDSIDTTSGVSCLAVPLDRRSSP